jgi:sporulation protein YlmC with PRC-barrel domain
VSQKVYRWVFVLLLASVLALAGCEEWENNGEPAGLDRRGSGEQIFGSEEGRPGRDNDRGEILPDTGSERDRDDEFSEDRRDDEIDEDRRDNRQLREDLDRNDLYYSRDLIGYQIQTRDGEGVGHVRSLLIHPTSGQIHYLILDVEDNLNPNGRHVLVPWTAVEAETYRGSDNVYEGIPPGHLPPPASGGRWTAARSLQDIYHLLNTGMNCAWITGWMADTNLSSIASIEKPWLEGLLFQIRMLLGEVAGKMKPASTGACMSTTFPSWMKKSAAGAIYTSRIRITDCSIGPAIVSGKYAGCFSTCLPDRLGTPYCVVVPCPTPEMAI